MTLLSLTTEWSTLLPSLLLCSLLSETFGVAAPRQNVFFFFFFFFSILKTKLQVFIFSLLLLPHPFDNVVLALAVHFR